MGLSTLRLRGQNETRKKGPRSPGPKVLAMKLNHLPEASQVPFFLFSFCFRRNCMCLKFSTSEIASPRKLLKLFSSDCGHRFSIEAGIYKWESA